MSFIKRIFTWWNGSTFGTNLQIRSKGEKVGEDAYGNRYYQQTGEGYEGRQRRWVTYKGYADASRVPPEWQCWLTYTHDIPPSDDTYVDYGWEKEHRPNLTGTVHAYKPKGSLDRGGVREKIASDYEAWSPDA